MNYKNLLIVSLIIILNATLFAQWSLLETPTSQSLNDIYFINADTGICVGQFGTILQTNDGGQSFYQVDGFSEHIVAVRMVDDIAYAVGNNGFVIKSTDYGYSWEYLSIYGASDLRGMYFINQDKGFVCGSSGYVFTTLNGGESWSAQYLETAWLRNIEFVGTEVGYLVGDYGNIFKTTNGGVSWSDQYSGTSTNLVDLSFIDEQTGLICGNDGVIYKTINGGETWTQVYYSYGDHLRGISMINESLAYAVGPVGMILKTMDGGETWSLDPSGATSTLFDSFFLSSEVGYICGDNGIILKTDQSGGGLTEGLILYYPFSGNADDLSGNDIHGIADATLTTDRFGFPNSAYHFDGQNESIEIPYDPIIKPELPVTVSLWAYFEETPVVENFGLFTNEYLENYYTGIWMTYNRQNKIDIAFGDGGGISEYSRRSKRTLQTLDLFQWYHIVGVYRGTANMELYINCMEDDGEYHGYGGPLNYSSDLLSGAVGKKHYGNLRYFHGKLDEIAFWNRALTPEEIEIFCCNGGGLTDLEGDFNEKRSIARVYPNPATTQITVEIFNSTSLLNRFVLFDILGNQVLSAENIINPYTTFNIENLMSGIYVYIITNQNNDQFARGNIIVK